MVLISTKYQCIVFTGFLSGFLSLSGISWNESAHHYELMERANVTFSCKLNKNIAGIFETELGKNFSKLFGFSR